MLKQLGFLFNADRCIGCNSCTLACLNEHHQDTNESYRRVVLFNNHHFLSISCNHCASPECFRVCPSGAFTKRQDGIVELDNSLCNGCGICVTACPYGAIQYNARKRKVEKCNLCSDQQEKGILPSCVQACTTSALSMINLYEESKYERVKYIEGFVNPRMTQPSMRFVPQKPKKRYWVQ